jgi:glucose-1-phosphate adenylyltransferase
MGIYIFNYDRLVELLDADPNRFDFGGEIIPAAIEKLNVQAHLFNHYWEDIGRFALLSGNLDLASPLPKFDFFNDADPIYTRSRYLPPSKDSRCDIDNSMISEGCILNAFTPATRSSGSEAGLTNACASKTRLLWAGFFESFEEIQRNFSSLKPHVGVGENSISAALL